jgi:hypothetical protein
MQKLYSHTHCQARSSLLLSFEKFITISNKLQSKGKARNRQVVKKPNLNIFLQKKNPTIFLKLTSASLSKSVFQTTILR